MSGFQILLEDCTQVIFLGIRDIPTGPTTSANTPPAGLLVKLEAAAARYDAI